MSIANVNNPVEVLIRLDDILREDNADRRVGGIRALLVETLDWQPTQGPVPVRDVHEDLPSYAHLIAYKDGINAVYLHLEYADRVTAEVVRAAARSLDNTLADDLLLLFTNLGHDEFHIILPDHTHSPPRLRRLVAQRDEHNRGIALQLASMWHNCEHGDESVHDAIAKAFSGESMTERFYTEYKRTYATVKSLILGFADDSELELFSQTLLNRLMFIHFISLKGWLTYEGSTDYLNALWSYHDAQALRDNFHETRLEPLFFAEPNDIQHVDLNDNDPAFYATIRNVPYLDCGMFDES